jgi:hypothetical protein
MIMDERTTEGTPIKMGVVSKEVGTKAKKRHGHTDTRSKVPLRMGFKGRRQ